MSTHLDVGLADTGAGVGITSDLITVSRVAATSLGTARAGLAVGVAEVPDGALVTGPSVETAFADALTGGGVATTSGVN